MGIFRKKGTTDKSAFANQLASTLATTSKQLVWLFSINGIAWIWCSYILAFMGKTQIAESLSSNVCTIIIGNMGTYLVTKTVENVFQYNDIFGPKANGIVAPITETSVSPVIPTPPVMPVVQTVSPSVSVEQTTSEEEENFNVANQLDDGAAPIPDDLE
ncbi:MAG: hypothetical protein NC311_05540 [Muribaculaceae bacterium]|nr:hypothetical protein [Muribaculaceae bacterium]